MSETDLVTAGTAPEAGAPDTGGTPAPTRRKSLSTMVLAELRQLAGELNIADTAKMRKGDLVAAIKERQAGGSARQLPLPEPAVTSTNGVGGAGEAAVEQRGVVAGDAEHPHQAGGDDAAVVVVGDDGVGLTHAERGHGGGEVVGPGERVSALGRCAVRREHGAEVDVHRARHVPARPGRPAGAAVEV